MQLKMKKVMAAYAVNHCLKHFEIFLQNETLKNYTINTGSMGRVIFRYVWLCGNLNDTTFKRSFYKIKLE